MPRWDFECSECKKKELDLVHHRCDPELIWPSCCGQRMEMLFGNWNNPVTVFESFTTTNLHPDGQEITVTSQTQLSRLQNEMGCQRVDDPHLRADEGRFVRETAEKQDVFDLGRRGR